MARLRLLEPADLEAARAVLGNAGLADAAQVAAEKLGGPSPIDRAPRGWVALDQGALVGVAASSGPWIRLLAVTPHARRSGIGGSLLDALERDIAARGERTATTLAQPGNYLSPGVALDDGATIAWLERRGYRRGQENTNLQVALTANPRVNAARAAELTAEVAAAGYTIRRATPADRAALRTMIERDFDAPPWAFEVELAIARAPGAVHVALAADRSIVGFAAHDGNNGGLGGFGPTGTLPEHRGRRIGETLLLACLLDIAAAGRSHATIAWIGPRDFYQRAVGIAGETRFVVLDKELST